MHLASLIISHPGWLPEKVTEAVGLTPHTEFSFGGTHWQHHYARFADDPDLATFLDHVLEELAPRKAQLQRLRESGGTIELLLNYTVWEKTEITFSSTRTALFSALGVDISLCLHPRLSQEEMDARFPSKTPTTEKE